MRRHTPVLTALLAIILVGLCLTAQAQGVRFITPEDGDTVRDMVRLRATKPNPDDGWISYKVERGGEGEFVTAVTSPFSYVWNTRDRDEDGKDLYPDGQYTLTAVALNPSGRKVGEASITVTLKNAMAASEAPSRVPLRLWYTRNAEVHYRAEGRWDMKPDPEEEDAEDVYTLAKEYNGALVANWKNKVMSPSIAAGHAVLHVVAGRAGTQYGTGDVSTLRHVDALKARGLNQMYTTYLALAEGEMQLKHDDEPRFELAEMLVPLPDRPVRVGDSWEGSMTIFPDPLRGTVTGAAGGMGEAGAMGPGMGPMGGMEPGGMGPEAMGPGMVPGGMPGEAGMMGMPGEPGMGAEGMGAAAGPGSPLDELETRTVRAKHTVEGFEWVADQPTVRIRSTYSVDDDTITIPGGGAAGGGGVLGGEPFGGMPGEMMGGMPGEMMGGMPPEMGGGMAFGDEMAAGMGAGPGMGGMGGGASAEVDTSYTGERITWWAYQLDRPVRVVDTITHSFEVQRAAAGMGEMGMGPGLGGMPMEPMGPGAMMPPGMEGGMMPGEPGMAQPGMPGMPGMPGEAGMMQMPGEMGMGGMPGEMFGMPGGAGMGGMGQAQQQEPMKVKVTIGLTIREVRP
ncbi:MAG: hypothetical protein U9R79_15925 [Armatimonadota bacterium]|nr:hypothetical protein [Armatimonadota bacterium]